MGRRFKSLVQLDSGLLIPAGAGAGKVLTSDASGNAAWANAPASGGSVGVDASARVNVAAAWSVPHNATTQIPFDTKGWDTNGMVASPVNGQITIKTAGKYLLESRLIFSAATAGTQRVLTIRVNGTTVSNQGHEQPSGGFSINVVRNFAGAVENLAVGDVVTAAAFQDTGAALGVTTNSPLSAILTATRIGDVGAAAQTWRKVVTGAAQPPTAFGSADTAFNLRPNALGPTTSLCKVHLYGNAQTAVGNNTNDYLFGARLLMDGVGQGDAYHSLPVLGRAEFYLFEWLVVVAGGGTPLFQAALRQGTANGLAWTSNPTLMVEEITALGAFATS